MNKLLSPKVAAAMWANERTAMKRTYQIQKENFKQYKTIVPYENVHHHIMIVYLFATVVASHAHTYCEELTSVVINFTNCLIVQLFNEFLNNLNNKLLLFHFPRRRNSTKTFLKPNNMKRIIYILNMNELTDRQIIIRNIIIQIKNQT